MKKLMFTLLVLLMATTAFGSGKIDSGDTPLRLIEPIDLISREVPLSFTEFTAAGASVSLVDAEVLFGSFSGALGDFVLVEDGIDYTYCDDLMVLVANADLTDLLLQVGGFSSFGATHRFGWPLGGSSAAGTVGGGNVDFGGDIDVSGYFLWLGNGYGGGGDGVWTGTIDLLGNAVGNEQLTLGAVKALYR